MSLSRVLSVDFMFLATNSFEDKITEFDGVNGIATKLLMVGLFCVLSLSNILTASIEERLSSFIVVILATLFLSKSVSRFLIL